MPFLGWLSDPFQWLSDRQLGNQKGTLNFESPGNGNLVEIYSTVLVMRIHEQRMSKHPEDQELDNWLVAPVSPKNRHFTMGRKDQKSPGSHLGRSSQLGSG